MSNSQSASNKAAVCQRTNWKHRQPLSTPSRMGRVVKKLAATPKRRRPQVSRRRLTAPSPKSIRCLSKEALRQHLLNNSLDTAGTRQQMVSRLTTFIKAAKAHSKDQRQENKQAPDQRPEANNRESTPTSDSSEARDSIAHSNKSSSDSSETPAEPPSKRSRKRQRERTPSSSSSEGYSRRKRHHRRYSSSSSSSSSSSGTFSSSSSSSSGRHSCRRKHKRRHRRSRKYSPVNYYPGSITCAPPLSRSLRDRIRRGKYVVFDKLLLPHNVPPTQKHVKGKARRNKRHVVDLPSWLEAWNRYICVRLAYNRSMALELVKYQTIMVMLFANHPPARCLEYDSLFRQAAARDPTLRWDTIKEDIYVWAITQRNNTSTSQFQPSISTFRDRLPISARLGPPPSESGKTTPPHATHTTEGKEICKRYNAGHCTRGEECIFTHVCWHPGCQGEHPGKECAKRT